MNETNTTTKTRPTADELNAHLASGGVVQVTTYMRSTLYDSRHAGWFSERKGSLHVQSGRRHDCLSCGDRLMVGIRLGRKG